MANKNEIDIFILKQIQNNDNNFIVKVFIFILLENKYIIITKYIYNNLF